jgi:hypothetical protein
VARRRELEAAIDGAIRTSAFTLVYQPIVVLGSDEMVGVEAPGVQRARRQSHGAGVSATRGETYGNPAPPGTTTPIISARHSAIAATLNHVRPGHELTNRHD